MQARCVWIERDENGRPRCEHGWALKSGPKWLCPEKKRVSIERYQRSCKGLVVHRRYNDSEKGRARTRKYATSAHGKSTYALQEIMRVRF